MGLRAAKPLAENPVSTSPAEDQPPQPNAAVCPPMPPLRPPCVQIQSALELPRTSRVGVFQLLQLCLPSSRSVRAFALPSLPSSV
jgi:hypothetical protein